MGSGASTPIPDAMNKDECKALTGEHFNEERWNEFHTEGSISKLKLAELGFKEQETAEPARTETSEPAQPKEAVATPESFEPPAAEVVAPAMGKDNGAKKNHGTVVTFDPQGKAYGKIEGTNYWFVPAPPKECLEWFNENNAGYKQRMGIQLNQDQMDMIKYWPTLGHCINNLGDPVLGKCSLVSTKDEEKALLHFLVENVWGGKKEDWWGYLAHGSSESNIHACKVARNWLVSSNDAPQQQVFLVSAMDAHYSISKTADILGINWLPIEVDDTGCMILTDLQKQIKNVLDHYEEEYMHTSENKSFIVHAEEKERALIKPCFIVVACSGSVRTGAIDDGVELWKALQKTEAFPLEPERYWLHLDAALGGFVTPFLPEDVLKKYPYMKEVRLGALDPISRKNYIYNSQSASFHKRVGCPWPMSACMIRHDCTGHGNKKMVAEVASPDTTLTGSRNGHAAILLKGEIMNNPNWYGEMKLRTKKCLDIARYTVTELNKRRHGKYTGGSVTHADWARALDFDACTTAPYMMCVLAPVPPAAVLQESRCGTFKGFALPSTNGKLVNHIHMYTMEHIDKKSIDTMLQHWEEELAKGNFP